MDFEKGIFSTKFFLITLGLGLSFYALYFIDTKYISEGMTGVFEVLIILCNGVTLGLILQQLIQIKEKEKKASVFAYEENLLKNSKRKN